jgi:Domain of unknown function (DUF4301)
MSGLEFSESDLRQMKAKGISPAKVSFQLERFKKGFPFLKLNRPCTLGDGIHVLESSEMEALVHAHTESALAGRTMKFVPASGAASRMFKSVLKFYRPVTTDKKRVPAESENQDPDYPAFLQCMKEIKRFAFFDALKTLMLENGRDIEGLLNREQFEPVLEYMLTQKGLNLAGLPKGLIPFHHYPDHTRTPFEEQMAEGASYVGDRDGLVRLHFTVSAGHQKDIKDYIDNIRDRYESGGVVFDLAFSVQKTSTDTIGADMDNRPLRGKTGKLLFRPGGHGALLENLYELQGDVVFIKNIDNVVPDRLKPETILYKKALGGYLAATQKRIFEHLHDLLEEKVTTETLEEISAFAQDNLSILLPEAVKRGPKEERIRYLAGKLNRPLRVCGMVKNEGEPGGGPFWVEGSDKTLSRQIVESNQVDMESDEQRSVWESSTYFNPVDLVCGVRDYKGRPFDLTNFSDPETGFISVKSHKGRELKALELPGLWNGAMARWNTIFVEVPLITFNPVKTILDLLRKEHQPG